MKRRSKKEGMQREKEKEKRERQKKKIQINRLIERKRREEI